VNQARRRSTSWRCLDTGKRFDTVLEEQALRTWLGTAEVQAGQLGRLLKMTAVPTVSLGIIPIMTERAAGALCGRLGLR
jgi:hypothetical protein